MEKLHGSLGLTESVANFALAKVAQTKRKKRALTCRSDCSASTAASRSRSLVATVHPYLQPPVPNTMVTGPVMLFEISLNPLPSKVTADKD